MRRTTACLAAAALAQGMALDAGQGAARANPALPMSIADLLAPAPTGAAEGPVLAAVAAIAPLFAGLLPAGLASVPPDQARALHRPDRHRRLYRRAS